jgi:ribosome-binding protein aMBF1 (putative translation factor)
LITLDGLREPENITHDGLCQDRLETKGMPKGKTRVHYADYQEMVHRLRSARLEAKLSQAEAALRLGKPQSFISKIERLERRIDPPELLQLALLYRKTWEYFLVTEEVED